MFERFNEIIDNSLTGETYPSKTVIEDIQILDDGRHRVLYRRPLNIEDQTLADMLVQDGKICITLEQFKDLRETDLNFK